MPDLEVIIRRANAGNVTADRTGLHAEEARRRTEEDPKGALAWAANLPKEERDSAVELVVSEWTEIDAAAAFDGALFLDEKDADLRHKAIATVLTQWAGWDPASAWKSAQTLPSASKERALIEMQIAIQWAGADTASAAQALAKGAALTGFYAELAPAIRTVAQELASQNVSEAKAWAVGLPEGPAQSGAVSSIVSHLNLTDPAAAAEWLNELRPGAARDAGVLMLLASGTDIPPADGMRWAETIGQASIRTTLASQMTLRWLATQPEQAKAWLRDSALLTDGQKQTLLDLSQKLPPVSGTPAQAQAR